MLCNIKGGVAQMVERVLCMHEAAGSTPVISTFCAIGVVVT